MPGFDAGDIESKLTLDRSQWNRELRAAEKDAAEFEKKKRKATVGLHLDTDKARADLEKFQRDMANDKKAKLRIVLDTDGFKKDLQKLYRDVASSAKTDQRLKFTPTLDTTKIKAEVAALANSLKGKIKFEADTSALKDAATKAAAGAGGTRKVNQEITPSVNQSAAAQKLAATLKALDGAQNVVVNINVKDTEAKKRVEEFVGQMSKKQVNIKVDANVGGAVAQIGAVTAATKAASSAMTDAGAAAEAGLGEVNSMGAIAAALFPVVGTGIAAIPSLLFSLVNPAAAVALGMDGIKAAAVPLLPFFADLKNAVSATFQNGLEPAMKNIGALMPTLTAGFTGSASALTTWASAIGQVVASSQGIDNISRMFTNTNNTIKSFAPSIQSLISNFLKLGDTGTAALSRIPPVMLDVSRSWDQVVNTITSDGSAERAISSLMQSVVSLLGALAPLVQLGTQIMAALGPGLFGAITALGGALQVVAGAFSALPGPIQTAVAALLAFKAAQMFLGRGAAAQAAQTAALTTALRNSGAVMPIVAGNTARVAGAAERAATSSSKFGSAMSKLGGFIGVAGAVTLGAVAVFSVLGDAQERANQKALEATQSVKAFSDAMRASGGAINQNITSLVAQRASALGLDESLTRVGVTSQNLTGALAGTGRTLNSIKTDILATSDVTSTYRFALDDTSKSLQDQGVVAKTSGLALAAFGNGLFAIGDALGITHSQSATAAEAVGQLGEEFKQGEASAKKLSEAQAKLNENVKAFGGPANTANFITASWAAAYTALTDDTLSAADATKVIASAMGSTNDVTRNMAAANMSAAGELQNLKSVLDKTSPKLVDNTGKIDLMAKGGLDLQNAVLNASASLDTLYGATLKQTGSVGAAAATWALGRQRLIDMGVAAGIPRDAMTKLVDTFNKVPAQVSTDIKTPGAVQAIADALGIKDAIVSIPDDKSIIVKKSAITDETKRVLQSLGLVVKDIPGTKNVLITAEGDPAKSVIDQVQKAMDLIKQKFPPPIDADPKPAEKKATSLGDFIKGLIFPPVPIDADPKPAQEKSAVLQGAIEGTTARMGIDGVDRGLQGAADAAKANVDKMLATMGIDAIDRGAQAAADAVRAMIDSLMGNEGINAVDRGAKAAADTIKKMIDSLMGTEGVNAADRGAKGVSDSIKASIDRMLASMGITAVDRGAISAAQRIRDTINGMTASIGVTVSGSASAPIRGAEGLILPKTQRVEHFAAGGFGSHDRMDRGMQKLSPMPASMARFVGPNTWRIIGDRSENAEAFIPINRTGRSRMLLEAAAKRMGYVALDLQGSVYKWIQQLIGKFGQKNKPQNPLEQTAGSTPTQSPTVDSWSVNTIDDNTWNRLAKQMGLGNSAADTEKITAAIADALKSRTVESLTVQAPQGASVQEVVNEAMFRIRHANKGCH